MRNLFFCLLVTVSVLGISRYRKLLWKEEKDGYMGIADASTFTWYEDSKPTKLVFYGGSNTTQVFGDTSQYIINEVKKWERTSIPSFGNVMMSGYSNWIERPSWEDGNLDSYKIDNSIGIIVAYGMTGFGLKDYFNDIYVLRDFSKWEKISTNLVPDAPKRSPSLSQVYRNKFVLFGNGPLSDKAQTCLLTINDTKSMTGDLSCSSFLKGPQKRVSHMSWSMYRYFYVYGGYDPVNKQPYQDFWTGRYRPWDNVAEWVDQHGEAGSNSKQIEQMYWKDDEKPQVKTLPYLFESCGGSYVSRFKEEEDSGTIKFILYGGNLGNSQTFGGVFNFEFEMHGITSSQTSDMKPKLEASWGDDIDKIREDNTLNSYAGKSYTLALGDGFRTNGGVKGKIPSSRKRMLCWVLQDRDDQDSINLWVLGGVDADGSIKSQFFRSRTYGVDFLMLSVVVVWIVGSVMNGTHLACCLICFPIFIGTTVLSAVGILVLALALSFIALAMVVTLTCPLIPIFMAVFLVIFCCCCCIVSCCTLYRMDATRKLKNELRSLEGDEIDRIMRQEEESEGDTAKLSIDNRMFQVSYDDISVEKSIGKGGSDAIIFKATWEHNTVAFKVFQTRTVCSNQDNFDEFSREVSILSSTSHPNILKFFGATLKAPRVGILMEYCEEGDLNVFLKRNPEYPIDEKIRVLMEISSGMSYLHARNIIHRDLKCENVLLTQEKGMMKPKIMDFGLSRTVDRMSVAKTKRIGTCFYMAPEVTIGEDYTEKCDVFSYAIIMWEVITSDFLPYGKKHHNVENKVAHDASFRPRVQVVKEVLGQERSRWFVPIMTKAWEHDFHDRPSFKEIYQMIRDGKEGKLDGDPDDEKMNMDEDSSIKVTPKQEEDNDDDKEEEKEEVEENDDNEEEEKDDVSEPITPEDDEDDQKQSEDEKDDENDVELEKEEEDDTLNEEKDDEKQSLLVAEKEDENDNDDDEKQEEEEKEEEEEVKEEMKLQTLDEKENEDGGDVSDEEDDGPKKQILFHKKEIEM